MEGVFDDPENEKTQDKGGVVVGVGFGVGWGRKWHIGGYQKGDYGGDGIHKWWRQVKWVQLWNNSRDEAFIHSVCSCVFTPSLHSFICCTCYLLLFYTCYIEHIFFLSLCIIWLKIWSFIVFIFSLNKNMSALLQTNLIYWLSSFLQ